MCKGVGETKGDLGLLSALGLEVGERDDSRNLQGEEAALAGQGHSQPFRYLAASQAIPKRSDVKPHKCSLSRIFVGRIGSSGKPGCLVGPKWPRSCAGCQREVLSWDYTVSLWPHPIC